MKLSGGSAMPTGHAVASPCATGTGPAELGSPGGSPVAATRIAGLVRHVEERNGAWAGRRAGVRGIVRTEPACTDAWEQHGPVHVQPFSTPCGPQQQATVSDSSHARSICPPSIPTKRIETTVSQATRRRMTGV
jgi:hypothetical protein